MSNPYNVETSSIREGDRVSIEGGYWGTVLSADIDYATPYNSVFYVDLDDRSIPNARLHHEPYSGKSCYMADYYEIYDHEDAIGPSLRALLDSLQKQINDLKKRIGGDV